jgi:hypothetical protein
MNDTDYKSKNKSEEKGLTLKEVIKSTLMAGLGVQSKEANDRNFTQGNFIQFVVVGVILAMLFVATIIFVVSLVVK